MKRNVFDARSVLWGTILAAAAVALSFLAYPRNPYHTAVLLPFFMAVYLMIAWFLYLRDDGLARKYGATGGAGSTRGARRVLAWAALELAALSVALYFLAGLGARYFD